MFQYIYREDSCEAATSAVLSKKKSANNNSRPRRLAGSNHETKYKNQSPPLDATLRRCCCSPARWIALSRKKKQKKAKPCTLASSMKKQRIDRREKQSLITITIIRHSHQTITLLNQSGVLKPPNLALALSIIPSNCSLVSCARSSQSQAASYASRCPSDRSL
jgi:hypothetical protein